MQHHAASAQFRHHPSASLLSPWAQAWTALRRPPSRPSCLWPLPAWDRCQLGAAALATHAAPPHAAPPRTVQISAVFVLYTVADAVVYENTLELATSILLGEEEGSGHWLGTPCLHVRLPRCRSSWRQPKRRLLWVPDAAGQEAAPDGDPACLLQHISGSLP